MATSAGEVTPLERSRLQRLLQLLLLLAISTGVAIRVYHYIVNRSLFLDEASLTLNLIRRTWSGLFEPLEHYQGAPVGFLLTQKLIMGIFGSGERALRLLPLTASLLGLLLYPAMLARYMGGVHSDLPRLRTLHEPDLAVVVLATAVLAAANYPVYYAVEVKQYSLDVFFCILLLYTGAPLLTNAPRRKDLVGFAVAAICAVTFSHPSVFVIAAVVLVGMLVSFRRERWQDTFAVGLTALPAALVFLLLYLLSLQSLTDDAVLLNFWEFGFMPLPPWQDWGWFGRAFKAFLANPAEMTWPAAWLVLLVGLAAWFRRRWTLGLVTLLIFAFVLVASAARAYPFAARLVLFVLPVVYFMAAEGVRWIARLLNRHAYTTFVWLVLSAVLLYGVGTITVRRAAQPYSWREHFRPAMSFMKEQVRENDVVYCYVNACPQFEYYAYRMSFPALDLRQGVYFGGFPETTLDDFDQLQGAQRVWVVMSRPHPGDDAAIRAKVNSMGVARTEFSAYDVDVTLYDMAQ